MQPHGLYTHEGIPIFYYNPNQVGKIQGYPLTRILSLPVHIPTEDIQVRDCLTFSSPPLQGKSFPGILWPGAQLPFHSVAASESVGWTLGAIFLLLESEMTSEV